MEIVCGFAAIVRIKVQYLIAVSVEHVKLSFSE